MRAERIARYFELAGWAVRAQEIYRQNKLNRTIYTCVFKEVTISFQRGWPRPVKPTHTRIQCDGEVPQAYPNKIAQQELLRWLHYAFHHTKYFVTCHPKPTGIQVIINTGFNKLLTDEQAITLALGAMNDTATRNAFFDYLEEHFRISESP